MKLTAQESPEIACPWIKLQKKNNDSQIKHFPDSFRPKKFYSGVKFLQAVYKLFVRFKLFCLLFQSVDVEHLLTDVNMKRKDEAP